MSKKDWAKQIFGLKVNENYWAVKSSASSLLSGEPEVFKVLFKGTSTALITNSDIHCKPLKAVHPSLVYSISFHIFHLSVWNHSLHICVKGSHSSQHASHILARLLLSEPCFLLFISPLHSCSPSPTHILQASSTLTHPPLICTWEPCWWHPRTPIRPCSAFQ